MPSDQGTVLKERRGTVNITDTNFKALLIPGLVLNADRSRYVQRKCLHWGGCGEVVAKVQGLGVRQPTPCMTLEKLLNLSVLQFKVKKKKRLIVFHETIHIKSLE